MIEKRTLLHSEEWQPSEGRNNASHAAEPRTSLFLFWSVLVASLGPANLFWRNEWD